MVASFRGNCVKIGIMTWWRNTKLFLPEEAFERLRGLYGKLFLR